MKNLITVALLSLASSAALANHHENCEVAGKKVHVKDKAACEKKKGTFIDAKAAAAAPAAAALSYHVTNELKLNGLATGEHQTHLVKHR